MKKKLVIYSDCLFTRVGLEYAIDSDPELSRHIDIFPHPEQQQVLFDIGILVMSQNTAHMAMQLSNTKGIAWSNSTNIILIAPQGKFTGVINYLKDAVNVWTIPDMDVTVRVLQHVLLSILMGLMPPESGRCSLLSAREKTVIGGLLEGKKAIQIARELGVNYKTVCTHKYTALKKLQARSLQKLLTGF